ncbi:LCM-domain-containing protein [Teratosphaeria nubilosa]|uniref:Leucine carboxyl methyltransferase 1 n=1 Tax=Teratosphaeria nubilosa TaxID=161662 RepID=A0A6G1LCS9_9PEZI|nr:LCM-domain-containing protein [Teratosphaeria nubilosa]
MASIPNLNTLRTGQRGPRLRGGRGGRAIPENNDASAEDIEAGRDKIVQQTDNDASSSRMSAVALAYLDDDYARLFLAQGQQIPKRYPIINRGTYVRTAAIDILVNRFLQTNSDQRKQIISLGAGSDTRFWRIYDTKFNLTAELDYHELDFESNVNQKRAVVRQGLIAQKTAQAEKDGWRYHLHAIDLRVLTNKSPPAIPNLNADLPTLIISECCLCYLPPDAATSVLQYFSMNLKSSFALVLYEPIRPFDAFGKTMVSNLASRGIHLQTLKRYGSLEVQRHRLNLAGFIDGQGARDVFQLYQANEWVSTAERERVEKLEWLDEVEEWILLASHYCVAWGWRGQVFGEAWRGLEGGRTEKEDQDAAMDTKYEPPAGPPPSYPQPAYDAGPAAERGAAAQPYYASPPPQQGQYGAPAPYQQQQPYQNVPGYPPQQQPYGQQPYGQPGYGQQPMGYYPQQQPPPGAYGGRGGGAGEGICAGILGALACCCCLDFCVF